MWDRSVVRDRQAVHIQLAKSSRIARYSSVMVFSISLPCRLPIALPVSERKTEELEQLGSEGLDPRVVDLTQRFSSGKLVEWAGVRH